jgi:hypothetical protein
MIKHVLPKRLESELYKEICDFFSGCTTLISAQIRVNVKKEIKFYKFGLYPPCIFLSFNRFGSNSLHSVYLFVCLFVQGTVQSKHLGFPVLSLASLRTIICRNAHLMD